MSAQFSNFRKRVDTKAPLDTAAIDMRRVRDLVIDLGNMLDNIVPDGPDKQRMFEALELAKYHANSGIIVADNEWTRR